MSSPDDISGVNLTAGSAGRHAIISIHKRAESTPRKIIHALLATAFVVPVVVDEDINVYDPVEVEWAIATRVRPDRDIIILPPVPPPPESMTIIPSDAYKWAIDATAPLTREPWLYRRAVPPGVDKVDYV